MKSRHLTVALLALFALSARAQEAPPGPAPMESQRTAALAAWRGSPERLERTREEAFPAHLRGPAVPYGLNAIDGVLHGVGPGYTARFEGGDFELRRRGGPGRLAFELSEIVRGGDVLWTRDLGAGALVQEGFEARAALTPEIEAHFRVGADGVEQAFLFRSLPPGRGDLVVRGRLASELRPLVAAAGCEGLELRDAGSARLHYGGVTGIDAAGRTRHGTLALQGDVLELRLPADLVDGASMPLVLDPIVSPMDTQMATEPFYEPSSPATAFDETSQRYLTVWSEHDFYGGGQVFGQFLTAGGTPVGGLLPLVLDAGYVPEPRLANVNASNRFLLVYRYGGIRARAVSAIGGGVSASVLVASDPGYYASQEWAVGGEVLPPYENAMVAWIDADSAARVRLVRVPASGSPVLAGGEATVHFGFQKYRICASASGGTPGRWMVAYRQQTGFELDTRIVGFLVKYDGTTSLPTTIFDEYGVDFPAVGGDGNTFMAAASRPGGAVLARPLLVNSGGNITAAVPVKVVHDLFQGAPSHQGLALDYVAGQPIVSYKAQASVSGVALSRVVGRKLLISSGLPIGAGFVLSELELPEAQGYFHSFFAAQSASAGWTPTHALLATSSVIGGENANVYTSRMQL